MARAHDYVEFFATGISRVRVRARSPCDVRYEIWYQKTYEVPGLPVGDNHVILGSSVWTYYQRMTDGQTDMSFMAKSCTSK